MADYELHADYDRSGRLGATPAEYARRATPPGALLLPNVDADRRRLPDSVALGPRILLDRDQPVVLASDDEALPLRIVVHRDGAPAGSRFVLRPLGFARIRLRINDAGGRILPGDRARPGDIPVALPPAPGRLELSLTMRTLAGSPDGRSTDLGTRFEPDLDDESTLRLQLLAIAPDGSESVLDEALLTIPPFVVLDSASVAVRGYVCELGDNEPSVSELRAAFATLGVPLVTVPADVALGDAWLQDQYQHALVQGPDGWRQVLLHLPRLRTDSSNGSSGGNLATFVRSHFPSRDIGVFDDLWQRQLQFPDATGRPRRLDFAGCERLAVTMRLPEMLLRMMIDHLKRLDPRFEPQIPRTGPGGRVSWGYIRGVLPAFVEEFRRRARQADDAGNDDLRRLLEAMATDARRRLDLIDSRLPFDAARSIAGLPTPGGQIEVTAADADRIHERVLQMHHSSNYGGNIEASPPTADAPLGKLVIGNSVLGDRDFMDPDLLRLLFKQRKQPIVQLDSSWLSVGHVDEFMAFAPDRRAGAGAFAVLRASSGLALALLEAAERRYLAGLPEAHPHGINRRPSGVLERLTTAGTAPVTRLLRGKVWRHRHARPEGDTVPEVREPPRIYQDIAHAMNGSDGADPDAGGINVHGLRFWPGEGPPRTYPADVSVRELLYGETDFDDRSCSAFIERQFLAAADARLAAAFQQARRFPLPVVFDRVASVAQWADDPGAFSTEAFTPDVVNLQAVNGHLLVPRPYGPRMRLVDAQAVLHTAAEGLDLPASLLRRVDERFVHAHGLRRGVYWLKREPPVHRFLPPHGFVRPLYEGLETEDQVIAQFRDSFPGADERELRRRIITPNRRHFDARGRLRDGWRRLEIAEDMVDLFELWIQAVATEIDAPLTWIDSWYYHVNAGGIHCGTNLLRRPDRARGLPNVWDVPDVGTVVFDAEEEDAIVAPAR